ncbi:hypothetical protein FQZ97_567680 [compost metagenome]
MGGVGRAGDDVVPGGPTGFVRHMAQLAIGADNRDGFQLRGGRNELLAGRQHGILIRVRLQPARVHDAQRHAAGDREVLQPRDELQPIELLGARCAPAGRLEAHEQGVLQELLSQPLLRHAPCQPGCCCVLWLAQEPGAQPFARPHLGIICGFDSRRVLRRLCQGAKTRHQRAGKGRPTGPMRGSDGLQKEGAHVPARAAVPAAGAGGVHCSKLMQRSREIHCSEYTT